MVRERERESERKQKKERERERERGALHFECVFELFVFWITVGREPRGRCRPKQSGPLYSHNHPHHTQPHTHTHTHTHEGEGARPLKILNVKPSTEDYYATRERSPLTH